MTGDSDSGGKARNVRPNHVVIEVPPSGREAAVEAIEYRVGPPVSYTFFRDWRQQPMLVLWGERLSMNTLERLSTACHELEQEHAGMAIYDAAQGADRMEGAFLSHHRQERYLSTDSD